MRLMFVTSGLSRGGAEMFLSRLAPGLARRGHECLVASLGHDASLAGTFVAAGVPVVLTGGILGTLRRFRPEVIQGWMYRGNVGALLAAPFAPKKPAVVWSIRQGLNDRSQSPPGTELAIWTGAKLARRPFAIVYNAESAKRQHEAAGYAADEACVIPNGIEVPESSGRAERRIAARARLGLDESAFVVAMPARWHPVKNHRGFVRAAGILARRRPEARFLLAGDGVDAGNETLTQWLRDEGVAGRTMLLGPRTDVDAVLMAADVATLASHGEAFPNALLEAMALGTPCVAPDVGDIEALVGDTGVVVAAGDDQALADGWERLAAMSATERHMLGEAARERARDRYGLDRAISAFEALYVRAVNAKS
jgi:glycosyltransferase involved in cell wall biosynthesis